MTILTSIQKNWLKDSKILIPKIGPNWDRPSLWNQLEFNLAEYYLARDLGSRELPQFNRTLDRSVLVLIHRKAVKFATISQIKGLDLYSRTDDHGSGDRLSVRCTALGIYSTIAYHPQPSILYDLAQDLSQALNKELHCSSSGYVKYYEDHKRDE